MVEIEKNRREESLQKKRCEGLQSQQIPSSLHSIVIEKKINSYHLSVIYLTQLLLSQSAQNPNVLICTPNFTIGSSRSCNFVLKDQTISANLCKIKHTQVHTNLCKFNSNPPLYFGSNNNVNDNKYNY
ncbi:hypothetical protein JHK86_004736 [Glycine max]|nr:hypothetical protein JHK86_004736 [Glycine max]